LNQETRNTGIKHSLLNLPVRLPLFTAGESGNTADHQSMKPTTRLFLTSTAGVCAALLVNCAGTQGNTQNRESMLVASGFKVITPKTAAQKQKLQNLPAGTVTMIKKERKNITSFRTLLTTRRTSVDPKSIRLINSSAPTRSSPGKISRTPRCIRMRRWSGVCGKVEEECGDRWAVRCREGFSAYKILSKSANRETRPFRCRSKRP